MKSRPTAANRTFVDLITSVPSSKRETHPIERVLSIAPGVKDVYRPLLRPGPVAIGKLNPSDGGFTVTEEVREVRVLINRRHVHQWG